MKQLLIILLLPFAFSCKTTKGLKVPPKVLEEEGFEIKFFYQPNSEYVTDLTQITNTSLSTADMPEQSSETTLSLTSTLKFGLLNDNKCEMLIVYDEMDMQVTGAGAEQVQTPELVGMKIYGQLTDGVQSIDSIVGGGQAVQSMTEGLLESFFDNLQVNFPNPMKIGEAFSDAKVIEVPTQGMGSARIITNTKYTLTKVTKGIADLTTQIRITGNMSLMGKEIPVEGTGSGMMSIDLEQHYSPSSTTTIDQFMHMDIQGMAVEQKISITATTKTHKVK